MYKSNNKDDDCSSKNCCLNRLIQDRTKWRMQNIVNEIPVLLFTCESEEKICDQLYRCDSD